MDKTKDWIRMCEKAEELQKGHVFVPGDYKSYEGIVFLVESCDSERGYYLFPHQVWLPTQEQLQQIVFKHLKQQYPAYEGGKIVEYNYNIFNLVNSFTNFTVDFERTVVHGNNYDILETTSIEQLWLMFVMKEKYSKIWDGNSWIPETTH